MMSYRSSEENRAIDLESNFELWWNREPAIMGSLEGLSVSSQRALPAVAGRALWLPYRLPFKAANVEPWHR